MIKLIQHHRAAGEHGRSNRKWCHCSISSTFFAREAGQSRPCFWAMFSETSRPKDAARNRADFRSASLGPGIHWLSCSSRPADRTFSMPAEAEEPRQRLTASHSIRSRASRLPVMMKLKSWRAAQCSPRSSLVCVRSR